MISVNSEWCKKICKGEKIVKIQKIYPKIQTPFKCYIYCTMHHPYISISYGKLDKFNYRTNTVGRCNGKVIGEFTCDCINKFTPDDMKQQACLTREEYFKKVGYNWHISNLKIYDIPKELNNFYPFKNYIDNICDEFKSTSGKDGGCIKHPPQSWCYVNEKT